MVASISWPFSSFTLNIALERASMIVPSCLIRGCFDIYFWVCKDRRNDPKKEKTSFFFQGCLKKVIGGENSPKKLTIRGVPMEPWSCQDEDSVAGEHPVEC